MRKQLLNCVILGATSFLVASTLSSVQQLVWKNYEHKKIKVDNNILINSDQIIIDKYHNTTYYEIFNESWNPEAKGLVGNTVNYAWTGSFGAPTWGKLKYNIPGGYAYFMTKLFFHKDDFVKKIKEWALESNSLSNNLKIKILIDLFINYIKIGDENKYRAIFLSFQKSDDLNKFLSEIEQFTIHIEENATEIIRGSLTNWIKNMYKNSDSNWVNNYINREYTKNGEDKAYDAGVNFFIYHSSTNPSYFLSLLLKGICENCQESTEKTHHFRCPRTFWSERTSGGNNYLSCLQYAFSIKKIHLFNYRPGKDIYR